ncbi:MAG: endo-1,4-beta-xylanase [Candidatus Marinimicrobia bacterium]|nr:endo-1,4-beta-xylanase [Candidatus Neomarinimicrobiota bacterium]
MGKNITRRQFIRKSAKGAAAVSVWSTYESLAKPLIKTVKPLTFKPFPHPWMPELNFVYASDENVDPFKSEIKITGDGIVVPEDLGNRKFGVNTQWFIEGFGFCSLCANNGGEYYSLEELNGKRQLNLNYEFANSRVSRNLRVRDRYKSSGTVFSPEVKSFIELSQEYLEMAKKQITNGEKCGRLANKSLYYSLWAGEKIELEHARNQIAINNRDDKVYFGCESRQYIWAKSEAFTRRFAELFNFATLTHYVWDTWYPLFEPQEGEYNWGIKDEITKFLLDNDITIEGRPLFWFHPWVTPKWLENKNFDQLKSYVDKHTRDLVGHYGNKVKHWEVVNEYHDWANIFDHTPEQITEIVRLACNKTKEINPEVSRLINNCSPWSEYVARGRMARMEASRPLRSTRQFVKDLVEAEVDFDVLGIQAYFGYRDLSDIMRMVERFEKFGKPIHITEIGTTSGPTFKTVMDKSMGIKKSPYDWHRPWDEELQADWLEQVYTLFYSRPNIKGINWYDFSNFRPFIVNGGMVKANCEPKRSFYRLKKLLSSWNRLPDNQIKGENNDI